MSPDQVIALSVVVIALAALCISILEGFQNRKHNRLSVVPYLSVDCLIEKDSPFKVVLSNQGAGPAIIKGIWIRKNGDLISQPGKSQTEEFMDILDLRAKWFAYFPKEGAPIAPGQRYPLIVVIEPKIDDTVAIEEILGQIHQIEYSIDYDSIYGESYNYRESEYRSAPIL